MILNLFKKTAPAEPVMTPPEPVVPEPVEIPMTPLEAKMLALLDVSPCPWSLRRYDGTAGDLVIHRRIRADSKGFALLLTEAWFISALTVASKGYSASCNGHAFTDAFARAFYQKAESILKAREDAERKLVAEKSIQALEAAFG